MDKLSDSLARDLNKLQNEYHKTVENALSGLDTTYLRKIQANYFRCGLKCCEDPDAPVTEVQRCIERCEAPLSHAHELMQSEVTTFQTRIQQCAAECSNQVRDKLSLNATDSQLKKAQQEVLICSQKCVDNQLSNGLPALISRLKEQLQKLRQDQVEIIS
ncbi:unnamed protein product [Heterobilharzia americana]|nr:unnamed protein product [Heterobilharzia americana]